jgi:acyl carrier protein
MARAIAALAERQIDVCLEVEKAVVLSDVRRADSTRSEFPRPAVPFSWTELPGGPAGDVEVWPAVASLYAAGADILWERLTSSDGRRVHLPAYPWQRQRLWALGQNRFTKSPAHSPATEDPPQSQGFAAPPAVAAEIRFRPGLNVSYAAPRTQLETDMVQSWSNILRIDGIGIHDNFFELGGDSLQATILLNHLEEQLGERVPGHVLFQVQTIDALANYLRQHCPDAVRRRYPDEAVAPGGEPAGAVPGPEAGKNGSAGSDLSIQHLARDQQADDLLARLDELSDEEVESLLCKAMDDEEDGS